MTTRQGILITDFMLSDERKITLAHNTIVVITGPNNVGKTTLLQEINRFFRRNGGVNFKGRILRSANYKSNGDVNKFIDLMKVEANYDEEDDVITVIGGRYKIETLRKAFFENNLPKAVQEQFVESLDPRERIGGYYNRKDPVELAADALFFDEETETRISKAFHRAFGSDMILHRERSGGVFMLGDRKNIPPHKKRLTPAYKKQIEKFPKITEQGAGIRSFARIALQIMTSFKSITLIDEPELFLHPPQVRHLARLIVDESSSDHQTIIATHSEAFVKGVIDQDDERVIVIRLQRSGEKTKSSILESQDIKALWADPLLRTSNILSALFHEVAVLMEGETDVRFTRALMEAVFGLEHLPDAEYYSCNGKSKIVHIAKALKSVNVPTIAVVDIDIIQNVNELTKLFEILGGNAAAIELDAEIIKNSVESDKSIISGRQLMSEIDQVTSVLQPKERVPDAAIGQIREILKRSSPWLRIKQDGIRGINDAKAVQAFNRIRESCAKHGLLINIEGELEGYCRTISRANKSEWLSEVLKRDLATDIQLDDARSFAEHLSAAVRRVIS